jgi:pantetheine-phosphate adenylyltransferase
MGTRKPTRTGPRIAVYPGTFDPITNGHSDLVARAAPLFDKVIVAVARSTSKAPGFPLEEGVELARSALSDISNVEVRGFDTLLAQFVADCGAAVILRGLRAVSDFEYEFQMVGMNQRLNPEIETVFLMADPRHQAIASRLVKEIAMLGGDVSAFTSPYVSKLLVKRCKERGKD